MRGHSEAADSVQYLRRSCIARRQMVVAIECTYIGSCHIGSNQEEVKGPSVRMAMQCCWNTSYVCVQKTLLLPLRAAGEVMQHADVPAIIMLF